MHTFSSEALETAYDHLMFVVERDDLQEDIAELERRLKDLDLPLFIKEYGIYPTSIKLEWDNTVRCIKVTYDGCEERITNLRLEVIKKVYPHLPDFLHSIATEAL